MAIAIIDEHLPDISATGPMTDEAFAELCSEHRDLMFEMTAEGELIVMAPTHTLTGIRGVKIGTQLDLWATKDGRGLVCDSSGGYVFPNGARRSPDASWTLKSRVLQLDPESREGFWHLCPDFVIELKSGTDRLKSLRQKMQEYIANGAQLGWLIDPAKRSVTIYRPNGQVETRAGINLISGEGPVAEFSLDLASIWSAL